MRIYNRKYLNTEKHMEIKKWKNCLNSLLIKTKVIG